MLECLIAQPWSLSDAEMAAGQLHTSASPIVMRLGMRCVRALQKFEVATRVLDDRRRGWPHKTEVHTCTDERVRVEERWRTRLGGRRTVSKSIEGPHSGWSSRGASTDCRDMYLTVQSKNGAGSLVHGHVCMQLTQF
jgi:hypothetical protein